MSTSTDFATTDHLLAGLWEIDPAHSSVEFTVRHMMTKVRGRFSRFGGTVTVAEDPLDSAVSATVELASVNTSDERRDGHLRSADFFDVEHHPALTFVSTGVRADGDDYIVTGDLSIHGVTRPVELRLEPLGVAAGMDGVPRAGFTATTELSRKAFGLAWNVALESGGLLVSDTVKVTLDIQAVRAAA